MYRKLFAAATLLAVSASIASAQNVSLSSNGSPIDGFGASANGGIPAVGQVFTAGDNYLTSFSFFLQNDTDTDPSSIGSNLQFRAYVYGFDGTAAAGSALYTSPVTSGTDATSFQQYLFNTGFTPLVPGNVYVAFLSTSGVTQNGLGFNAFAGTDDGYANDFVFDFADSNLGDPNTVADAGAPMAFNAAFATTTPEPSELMLFGTGLLGLVPVVRRKLRV